jgi:hypothetical protein
MLLKIKRLSNFFIFKGNPRRQKIGIKIKKGAFCFSAALKNAESSVRKKGRNKESNYYFIYTAEALDSSFTKALHNGMKHILREHSDFV